MSEPFLGEIKMFGGNYAPRGFAHCNGQVLAISSNTALFSLLGTIYGGDGRTTFALPDLRGRVPIHRGTGPGLTPRNQGSRFGAESVPLNSTHMPEHSHMMRGDSNSGVTDSPVDKVPSKSAGGIPTYSPTGAQLAATGMLENTGQSWAHNNMQPWIGINYIIALVGLFPSRN